MKTFSCQCGNTLHFENTRCLACGRTLGYVPEQRVLSALEPLGADQWQALHPEATGSPYRMCTNYRDEQVCNWVVPADDPQPLCRSCRHNHIIPNLTEPNNRLLWYRIEVAKRRLLYTLHGLRLPLASRTEDPEHGLAFEFLEGPTPGAEFSDPLTDQTQVITGHRTGLITINLAEADPSAREEMRERMNESYRTLLGHFRHESGHYYWDRLVRDTPWLDEWRALFGDERQDYQTALNLHYGGNAPPDWSQTHISAYATAHPWEDWAECWAHYLHMVDTLETAHDFGFAIGGQVVRPSVANPRGAVQAAAGYGRETLFHELLADWSGLTAAMNALNRSMGLPDAYPFVLSDKVIDKLRFVHEVIRAAPRG